MEKETSRRHSDRLEVAIGDNPELSARLLEMKERLQGGRKRQPKATKSDSKTQPRVEQETVAEVLEG